MPRMCRLLALFFLATALPLSSAQTEPRTGTSTKKKLGLHKVHAREVKSALKTVLPERVHCSELLEFEKLPLTPIGHLKDDDINFSEMGLFLNTTKWLVG